MPTKKNIHCYDYVNHPYEKVVAAMKRDAQGIFTSATKSAASRVSDVVAELHVNVAGIEMGKDVQIKINKIEETLQDYGSRSKTEISFDWSAIDNPGLFPVMHGTLQIYPLTDHETQLDVSGEYEVPLGILGDAIDAVVGHGVAQASALKFTNDIAAHLRAIL